MTRKFGSQYEERAALNLHLTVKGRSQVQGNDSFPLCKNYETNPADTCSQVHGYLC